MLDSKTRMLKARIVDKKGVDEYAIKAIKSFVELLAYKRLIGKFDNENAIQLPELRSRGR